MATLLVVVAACSLTSTAGCCLVQLAGTAAPVPEEPLTELDQRAVEDVLTGFAGRGIVSTSGRLVWSLSGMSKVRSRTLQHYDAIGLLAPAYVGTNGYRFYRQEQLLRLQQILTAGWVSSGSGRVDCPRRSG